jgi:hypothetical protein
MFTEIFSLHAVNGYTKVSILISLFTSGKKSPMGILSL